VNAWTAARFTLPGIVAHRSALAGGQRLDIPDLGEPSAEVIARVKSRATGA
jgi:hypothetical protein